MRYLIKNIFISLLGNIFEGLINIICLSLGMLVATIFISQANNAIASYKSTVNYMYLDNTLLAKTMYFDAKKIQLNEIDNIKRDMKNIKEIIPLNYLFENVVIHNKNYISGVGTYTTDINFSSLFKNNYMSKGGWIETDNDCVVGKRVAEKYNIDIGASIIIGSNNYYVSGIIEIPSYKNSIFISQNSIRNLKIQDADYYIVYEPKTDDTINEVKEYINANYGSYKFSDRNEIIDQQKQRLRRGWGPSIVISVITFLYGIINLKNIDEFYYIKKKVTYGIMRAYGATRTQLLMTRYIESGVLAIISSTITFVIARLLQYTRLNDVITMKVDISIFIILLIMGQVFAMALSIINMSKLNKQEISDIVRDII